MPCEEVYDDVTLPPALDDSGRLIGEHSRLQRVVSVEADPSEPEWPQPRPVGAKELKVPRRLMAPEEFQEHIASPQSGLKREVVLRRPANRLEQRTGTWPDDA